MYHINSDENLKEFNEVQRSDKACMKKSDARTDREELLSSLIETSYAETGQMYHSLVEAYKRLTGHEHPVVAKFEERKELLSKYDASLVKAGNLKCIDEEEYTVSHVHIGLIRNEVMQLNDGDFKDTIRRYIGNKPMCENANVAKELLGKIDFVCMAVGVIVYLSFSRVNLNFCLRYYLYDFVDDIAGLICTVNTYLDRFKNRDPEGFDYAWR